MLHHGHRHLGGFGGDLGADALPSMERSKAINCSKKGMPRVSSMLFDLELEDQDSGELENLVNNTQHGSQLLKLLQPASQAEKQLGLAVNAAFEAAALRGKAPTIEQLADSLRSQNYDVRIRTALGGGGNQECLRNLRHHFLTLTLTGADGRLTECIIDPSFAEQWGIARPTAAYAAIVDALPQVYVGSNVEPVVDFLCGELAKAFKAEGATLPPWRAADAMLSKWRPRRSVDRDLLPPQPAHAAALSSAFSGAAPLPPAARRSIHARPSKSQRLSTTGERRSSTSSGRSPSPRHLSPFASAAAAPAPRGHSSLSSTPRRLSYLKKSASNALSDAEAEAGGGRTLTPPRPAAPVHNAVAGDVDSDESAHSDAASFRRYSSNVSGGMNNHSTLTRDSIDFSSSWKASDTVPFPQSTFGQSGLVPLINQSSSNASGNRSDVSSAQKVDWQAAAMRNGGFGSMRQGGGLWGDGGGAPMNHTLPRAARNSNPRRSAERERGVSASDGSDTTQAPVVAPRPQLRTTTLPMMEGVAGFANSFAIAPPCAMPSLNHTSCPLPLPATQSVSLSEDGTPTLFSAIAPQRSRVGGSAHVGSPNNKRAVHRVPPLQYGANQAFPARTPASSDDEVPPRCSTPPFVLAGLPSDAQAAAARSNMVRHQLGLLPLPHAAVRNQ
mmetsp:Transcript_12857/g.38837  ORF Transcript_12857/g.38837 Transcript_12857/m.38837 type:complete len:669 (+) Transcript_12857:273-2279(+)